MNNQLKNPPHHLDHYIGDLGARIVMVEYGDYQCPYSAVLSSDIDKLIEEFGQEFCYVYRHFPLKTIHPFGEWAAKAAEAANEQNQFWNMHELLFQHSAALTPELIKNIAARLNLDLKKLKKDLTLQSIEEKIDSDIQSGLSSGVTSTPTLFINSYLYDGPSNHENIRLVINGLLNDDLGSSFYY